MHLQEGKQELQSINSTLVNRTPRVSVHLVLIYINAVRIMQVLKSELGFH